MADQARASDGAAGRAILAYGPSRFFEPLLGLLALPVLTRALSTEQYGDLSVLLVTATFLRTLGFDWVANCALRFRMGMAHELDRFFPNVVAGLFMSAVALGLVLAVVQPLAAGRFASGAPALVLAYLAWMFVDALAGAFAYCGEMVLRATNRPRAFSVSRILQALARHGLGTGALVAAGGAFGAYFGARCAGLVLIAAWSWWTIRGGAGWNWRRVDAGTQKTFLAFGLPLTVSMLAYAIRPVVNRYVVLGLTGSEAAGLYAAADNIGGMPLLVFQQVVMLGLYPVAISVWEKGEDILPIVRSGMRYYGLTGLPALAGLALLARPLLTVVAGAEYGQAAAALRLLALSMLAFGVSQYFSLQFMVAKRTGVMASVSLGAGALNLLLALLLVPRHGYVAAAAASVASNVVLAAGMAAWGVGGRWWQAVPWLPLLRSLLAVAAMALAVAGWLAWRPIESLIPLLAAAAAGAVLYAAVLTATGEITAELSWLRRRLGHGS